MIYTQTSSNDFRIFEQRLIQEIIDLYNLKNEKKLNIIFHEVDNFPKLFDVLETAIPTGKQHSVMSINKISDTEKRRLEYDFSVPYMINKYVVLRLKSRADITEKSIFKKGYNVGIVKNTIYTEIAKELDKNKTLRYTYFLNNESCATALKDKKIDLYFSDYVDTWIYNLEIVKVLKPEIDDKLAILFPKGSDLQKKLDKTIRYYVKSAKYYNLIRAVFGKERMLFYKQMIFSKNKS